MKYSMRFLIYFLVVFALFSCSKKDNTGNIVKHYDSLSDYILTSDPDSVVFDFGMSAAPNRSGTFYDEKSGEALFYAFNDMTDHRLLLVDFNNAIRTEIDLTEYRKKGYETETLDVLSMDTIVVLTRYTNQVFFINSRGEVWKHIDLNEKIIPPDKNEFEYGACVFAPIMMNDKTMLLTTYWSDNDTVDLNSKVGIDREQSLCYHKWNTTFLLKINDVYADSLKADFGLEFYKTICPSDSVSRIIPFPQYDFVGDDLYITSMHTNKILKVDPCDFSIRDSINIHSFYTSVGMDCIEVNEDSYSDLQNLTLLYGRNAGLISSLRYDKYRENFYVTLYAENPKPYNMDVKKRNWVLQKYDKDFNLLAEYLCSDEEFHYYLYFTKDAVWIRKNIYNYTEDADYGKHTMVFYELK